jgi:ABC-2 type transport system ATP-binding protein
VRGYSLGMRQRLSLAGALLGDPRVLILDEPANGLDPQGIRWLRDLLRGFAADGRTVLVSSHVLAEMQQLADDVVIIARGRIVAHGEVGEVVGRAGGAVRVRSPHRDRLLAALRRAAVDATPLDEDGLSVRNSSPARVGEIAAAEGVVLHELVSEAATLEEVFLELTLGAAGGADLRSAGSAHAPSETTGRSDRRDEVKS